MNKRLMGQVWVNVCFLLFTVLLSNCSDSKPIPATITSVQITSTVLNPASGSKTNIAVNVSGSGEFSKAVTWSAVPNLGSFSDFSEQVVFYTAPNVPSEIQVTIRATSVADSSKFGDLILTIKQATPPSLKISPTWAAYTEQVTADITGMNLSSLNLKLIDPITDQSINLTPNVLSNKVLFSVPSTPQISGGPKRLVVSDGSVTLNTTLNILGEVDATVVVLSVKPEFSETQVKTKLEPLGLTLRPNGFSALGGSTGVCAGSLAMVDLNSKPLGQTLELLKSQDFVWTADPQALWKADPETLWDRGNFGTSPDIIRNVTLEDPNTTLLNTAGEGMTLALLDTGITDFRSELVSQELPPNQPVSRVTTEVDFTGEGTEDLFNVIPIDPQVRALRYHGSLVAFMASGNTVGLARKASLSNFKVCDKYGMCLASRAIQGLCTAIDGKSDIPTGTGISKPDPNKLVLNLSLGGDTPVEAVRNILKNALNSNIAIAAAIGNEPANTNRINGTSQAHYPASFDEPNDPNRLNGLLVVGSASLTDSPNSTNKVWKHSPTSRLGSRLDLVAPGEELIGSEVSTGGTSFATALVSGALAIWRTQCPKISVLELESKLKEHARLQAIDLTDQNPNKVGKGMLFIPTQFSCPNPQP
jgi:subtilisin